VLGEDVEPFHEVLEDLGDLDGVDAMKDDVAVHGVSFLRRWRRRQGETGQG
jgi:hypothetical protein